MNNLKVIFDLNTAKTVFINPDEVISITPVIVSGNNERQGAFINMRFGKTYRVTQNPQEVAEFFIEGAGPAPAI